MIHTPTASWNEDYIRSIFTPFDVVEILKIPLCTRRVADFWAWHEETRGNFSVRSAYRVVLRTKMNREAWLHEEGGSSTEQDESNKWSMIWHIKVPSKLRMFVWRLARHSMPCGEVLKHRHMTTEDTYLLCGGRDTWKHALLSCPLAAAV